MPLLLRLQARIAPVDRLLAAREAAEDEEVDDLYKRSTGDPETDHLLREIRKDERSHSLLSRRCGRAPERARAATNRHRRSGAQRAARPDPRPRALAPPAGSWISGAIYGANDGLAAVLRDRRRLLGRHRRLAPRPHRRALRRDRLGALDGDRRVPRRALEAEVAAANLEREREEIAEHPEEEKEELSLFYQLKGLDEAEADVIVERLASSPTQLLQAIATEEFGIGADTEAATRSGGARRRDLDRARRDHPGDPVLVTTGHGGDRRRRGHRR